MSSRQQRISRRIAAIVDHPLTILVKGLVLLAIGLVDATRTLREGSAHAHIRVGHGLMIIGLFNILDAVPHLIDALDASRKYLEHRERQADTSGESHQP